MTSNKIPATVVVLTRNEEKHIARAVDSASDFAEVIVVDSNSTDKTIEIAEAQGARTLNFTWNGRYPKKKEWALGTASHDWVIYLDADEFLDAELVGEISAVVGDPSVSAFEVPLRYFWMGQELKHGHKVSKRIGIRRSKSRWPQPRDLHVANMWEVEGHYQPQVLDGRVATLGSKLGHSDEDGLYDYFARHNRYSDWEAHMLAEKDEESTISRSSLGRLAAHLPAKPLIFFAYSYLFRFGFLDGKAGLSYAMALSFYYWQIGLKTQEVRQEIKGRDVISSK